MPAGVKGKCIKPGSEQQRSVTIARAEVDEESREMEISFSSETPVERWYGREILDHSPGAADLARLNDGAPLLADHVNSVTAQIGVVVSARLDPEDRRGKARIRFSKSDLGERVMSDVRDDIVRNVSLRYRVQESRFDGEEDGIDNIRVMEWEPLELSFVAIPADATVGAGRANEPQEAVIINDDEGATMPEPIRNEGQTAPENVSQQQAAVAVAAPVRSDAEIAGQERSRVSEILTIGAAHETVNGSELARTAIEEGRSVEEFQRTILDAIGSQGNDTVSYGQGQTEDRAAADPMSGFATPGEFYRAVVNAGVNGNGGQIDKRLIPAEGQRATTYGVTSSGPEGGFTIPTQVAQGIVSLGLGEGSLLSMADNTPVSGNSMSFTADEGTPWGTTGVQANWEGEGATLTQSKETELEDRTLVLKKLTVLVPLTDEMLSDSLAMGAHTTRKMGERMDWKVQDAIVNGSGVGKPLGITNGGCMVTQAKETSQTADTIVFENIGKMFGRVLMGAGANLVWLINPDAYQQIINLNSSGNLIWTPTNAGAVQSPAGGLLGRPIVLTDTCQTLGDKNDIILANMAGYQAITKSLAEFSTSIHVWFDSDKTAFKLRFRMNGQPLLRKAVTPPNSTVTRSHFVNLAARA